MYKIISSHHFFNTLLIIILSGLFSFHLNVVPYSETVTAGFTEIYKIIFRWIKCDQYELLYRTITFIFLTVNVFLFLAMMIELRFAKLGDKFHGMVFLLINGFVLPYIDHLPNVMISLFLFLIILRMLFGILRQQNALFLVFKVGMILALASFFWYYSCYFFIYIFIGIIVLRTVDLREWLAVIVGLTLPYFIYFSVYFFIYSDFGLIFNIIDMIHFKEKIPVLSTNDLIPVGVMTFIILAASFKILTRYRTMEADIQDYIRLFFILFIFSVLIFLVYPGIRFSSSLYAVIPISIPVVYFLKENRRYYFKEIFTDLLLLSVLYVQLDYHFVS